MSDFHKGMLLGAFLMFVLFPTRVLEITNYCEHHGYKLLEAKP